MINNKNASVEQRKEISPVYNTRDKERSHSIQLTNSFQMQLSGETTLDTKELFNALKAVITRRKMETWWWEEKVMPILRKSGLGTLNLEQNYDKLMADYLEKNPAPQSETKTVASNSNASSADSNGGFRNARNLFTQAALNQKAKLEKNPFSNQYKGPATFDTNAADYGRPEEGSLTAQRGQKAHMWVDKNIEKMVEVVKNHGKFDNEREGISITFGDLFHVYTEVSDTLVGILKRAKKRKRLHFAGDMLFQGTSDSVVITVIDETVDSHFGRLEKLSGGGTKLSSKPPTMITRGNQDWK